MHYTQAKGILSSKNGMNLYRGCTHGCIYCDSRSKCYQMTHPFEDIEVRENAIELLEEALKRKRSKCMIGTGAMTDPYIPLEEKLGVMRKALSLIYAYGFGCTVITKSDLILRDIDLLLKIHKRAKCVVQMTLTTYDEALCRRLEPNVCTTKKRMEALKRFRDAGIPTIVWLSPILPFINDTMENISGLLSYCIEAKVHGILCFGMGLTLREGNREYFYEQLDRLFPGMKEEYIRRYSQNYVVASPNQEKLMRYFHETCEKHGILHDNKKIFDYLNTLKEEKSFRQLSLF